MLAIQQCFHLNLFPAFLYDTVPPVFYLVFPDILRCLWSIPPTESITVRSGSPESSAGCFAKSVFERSAIPAMERL